MTRTPHVVSAEPRLAARSRAQRQARRRSALRRGAWVVAALLPFVLAAWVLLGSSWLVVRKVVVLGEQRLTASQVLAAAQVRLGTPLARIDTGAVASRVRGLGPVLSVSVSRSWPSTLTLRVVERQPVAAVGSGRSWTLIDDNGARLGAVTAVPAGVVRLAVASPGPSDPSTLAALDVLRHLPKSLRGLVASVRAPSPEQVSLVLSDRRVVIWGGTSDGAAKAAALVPLLRLPGHVYDVSSPTVVTRR